jgi:beta-glucosidase
MDSKTLTFPKGFLWGTATAAHQVEGNNVHSDWWDFEQKGKTLSKETSGVAVDHYKRYEEDFDIAKSLNQNAHRFSIEWSRIEPEEGRFQIDEINHYKDVIQALKNRGMRVLVTLMHFTLPLWVAKKGGWSNKKTIKYFTRYIEQILPFFGEDVDFWITINEPIIYSLNAYLKGTFPPGTKNILSFLKIESNLALAHREAFFTIHKFYKDAVVGLAKNIPVVDPYN